MKPTEKDLWNQLDGLLFARKIIDGKEKELWDKLDGLMFAKDLDLMEILCNLDNGDFIKQLDTEDLILGISGLDDYAIERVDTRRESLKKIQNSIDQASERKSRAIEAIKSGNGSFRIGRRNK